MMADPRIMFLMYHELQLPQRPMVRSEPGYARYVLDESAFRTQMQFLKKASWNGLSVSQALTCPLQPAVAITFDDGCETDILTAAPILLEMGFSATFYVTAGFLGRRGYLSHSQLRELAALGFEIGCHSMNHAYLTDLDEAGLHHEIIEAKLQLEQTLGGRVNHFSCPGGCYDHRVAKTARHAGYRTVATSRPGPNTRSTDPFALGRIAMMRGTSLEAFERICRGRGLGRLRARNWVRDTTRHLLGNTNYDRLRAALLARDAPH